MVPVDAADLRAVTDCAATSARLRRWAADLAHDIGAEQWVDELFDLCLAAGAQGRRLQREGRPLETEDRFWVRTPLGSQLLDAVNDFVHRHDLTGSDRARRIDATLAAAAGLGYYYPP